MSAKTGLKNAYKLFNKSTLANHLGVHYQSIDKWIERNKMPCSDYDGRTQYSREIEILTKGQVTVEDLLGWRPPHQAKD